MLLTCLKRPHPLLEIYISVWATRFWSENSPLVLLCLELMLTAWYPEINQSKILTYVNNKLYIKFFYRGWKVKQYNYYPSKFYFITYTWPFIFCSLNKENLLSIHKHFCNIQLNFVILGINISNSMHINWSALNSHSLFPLMFLLSISQILGYLKVFLHKIGGLLYYM